VGLDDVRRTLAGSVVHPTEHTPTVLNPTTFIARNHPTHPSAQLIPSLVVGWYIWPIIQLLNFTLIPLDLRILYCNCINIAWTAYISNFAMAPAAAAVVGTASAVPVGSSASASASSAAMGDGARGSRRSSEGVGGGGGRSCGGAGVEVGGGEEGGAEGGERRVARAR